MYPGNATKKNIKVKDEKVLEFKCQVNNAEANTAVISPAANILESDTEYLIALAAPGLDREDFSIDIEDEVISISACHEKIKSVVTDREEYDLSDWTRKFALPADADPILAHAKYRNGELIIRIPRGNTIDNNTKATIYVY
jgi:HSP20 family protein